MNTVSSNYALEELGVVDVTTVEKNLGELPKTKRKTKYNKWTEEERWNIGKYASENGVSAAQRHFKTKFSGIAESTIRGYKNRYEKLLKSGESSKKAIPKYESASAGRPFMIGDLDKKVQNYIRRVADRGGVITRAVAVSVAKSLLARNPLYGEIVVNETWAQSLLRRMNFVRRQKTSDKVHIPAGARKEIEYQFYHQITSMIEKHEIPHQLVINFDQTPCKMVPVGRMTLAEKNSKKVVISGSTDKRNITGTFAVTLAGHFLPMQLIYGGKTKKSLPKYKFPSAFSLSVNKTHYSNSDECIKFLEEIIVPYVVQTRKELNLPKNQKALLIYDVFTGQTTTAFNELVEESHLVIAHVPNNMTADYQPLDATVNKYAKNFAKNKFNDWYFLKLTEQMDAGIELDDIDIKLCLSTLKPLHAGWLVELYNHMTTENGKQVILSGWRTTGILDAVKLGVAKLPCLDPFADIDPPIEDTVLSMGANLQTISTITEEERGIAYSRENMENDSDEEYWEQEGSEGFRTTNILEDDEE